MGANEADNKEFVKKGSKFKLSDEDIEALKKCPQKSKTKKEDSEFEWDGSTKLPPHRKLSEEEIKLIKERHKKMGIEE